MNPKEQSELEQKAVVAAGAIASAMMWQLFRGFAIAVGVLILLGLGIAYEMNARAHMHWTHHEDATGKWIPDKWQSN